MRFNSKATLQDVADIAKVSRMTASRVFSGKNNVSKETEEKIKKIAAQIGYHPNLIARSLSNRKSKTIGIFIPKTKQLFFDIYITQILSGISDVTQEVDYRIMFFPIDLSSDKKSLYISIARSHLIDGIIILKAKMNDPGLDELKKIKFPFVLVNHKNPAKKYNYVDVRNEEGSKLAIQYLYNLGHKKIAFVAGDLNESNALDRLKGYKKTIKSLGLPLRKEWIIYGDFFRSKAYLESENLLKSKNLPTAVFCSDDYMAIGLMDKIQEKGLTVPGDISIIGFDDIEISSYLNPSLTTIRQPMYEIGKRSAELLFELINKKRRTPVEEILDVELIIRKSTFKPKSIR